MLLNSYRLPSDTDKDMLLRTYLMAVEELSADAICATARRFIRGEVRNQDRRFAPSCAEFASEARSQQAIADHEARPKIDPPAPKPSVPKHWMPALFDYLAGRSTDEELRQITGYPRKEG